MEIAAMLALVGATAAIIITPLLTRTPTPWPQAAPGRRGAPAADALADLEFDHATGKLDDDDYAALRADLQTAGASEDARRAVDRPAAPPTGTSSDALEAEILAIRRQARFCVACGAALPKAARFCPDCGTPVGGRP
jgi:hypothetical protein